MSRESVFSNLYKKGIVESFPLHTSGYVLVAEALLMAICTLVFGFGSEHLPASLMVSVLGAALGFCLIRYFDSPRKVTASTGAFTINLLWAVAIVYGCIPYMIHGLTVSEAIFESISGFTTTGMSIITDVNSLEPSLLVWRAATGWAGGIGFIIMFCLLLKYFGLDGRNIFVSDGINKTASHSTKSIKELSMNFIIVYAILTGVLALMLAIMGNDIVDSLCISMSTISTTGFSTLNEDLTSISMASKFTIGLFLIFSAMNFMSLFSAMIGLKIRILINDPEIRQMMLWFVVSSILLIVILNQSGAMEWDITGFMDTILMIISIGTTTGFVFHDFSWPTVAMIFLTIVAMIGGCRESPTGGIKIARLTLIFKSMRNSISTVGFPNEVRSVKFGDTYVKNTICYAALTTTLIFLFTAGLGTIAICMTGVDMLDSFYLCISSLTTTGTGLYSVANVAATSGVAQSIMCILMWLGRMEITLAIVLFTPTFWKDVRTSLKNVLRALRNGITRT